MMHQSCLCGPIKPLGIFFCLLTANSRLLIGRVQPKSDMNDETMALPNKSFLLQINS